MVEQNTRWRAEAELIAKHGTLSARKLAELLKIEYGIVVSHVTVLKDLEYELDSLTEPEIEGKKSHILDSIEELSKIAYKIATGDEDARIRLSAMETYRKLMESRGNILTKFEEAKIKLKDKEKPIYNVFIGKPKEADLEKLKKEDEKNDLDG